MRTTPLRSFEKTLCDHFIRQSVSIFFLQELLYSNGNINKFHSLFLLPVVSAKMPGSTLSFFSPLT